MNSVEKLQESLDKKSILGKRAQKSSYHKQREAQSKEHFVSMLNQHNQEKDRMADMDEDELQSM